MPAPTAALGTLRPDLSSSLLEWEDQMELNNMIASRVFPVVQVARPSGTFGRIPDNQLVPSVKPDDTLRAPGAGYYRDRFTFVPDTYATEEHGVEEPVDEREAATYGDFFQAETIATMRCRRKVMINAERRVADLLFNATTFTGRTTGVAQQWVNNAAAAVPVTNVEAAVLAVYDDSGMWPNTLIINRKVFRALRQVDQIVDLSKAQGFMDVRAGAITIAQLATVFDLNVIVAGGTRNNADAGLAFDPVQIWGDDFALICKIATSGDIQEPCVGRVFHWGGDGSSMDGTIESYDEPQTRSRIIRHRHQVDEKLLHVKCGHLLTGIAS